MSIQLVNKAAEHLINSTPVLEKKKNQKNPVNAYLIKNRKGEGGGSTLISSRKDWAELYGCIK